MQTVSTLCASGTALSLSAVGLTLARSLDDRTAQIPRNSHNHDHTPSSNADKSALQVPRSMTAIASYQSPLLSHSYERPTDSRRAYSSPISRSHTTIASPIYECKSGKEEASAKHASKEEGPGLSTQLDNILDVEHDDALSRADKRRSSTGIAHANGRPLSWLRRLSSSMSSSHESIRPPTSRNSSRPSSAVFSSSNGLVNSSQSDWTTCNTREESPVRLPRNRLVKRTSSLRGSMSSPIADLPSSRIPIAVMKRPATSHQRSELMRDRLSGQLRSQSATVRIQDLAEDDSEPLRAYFTPHIPPMKPSLLVRSTSTGIPNPIRRVYPNRRYTPMLVSATTPIRPAHVETDVEPYDLDIEEAEAAAIDIHDPMSTASSPIPPTSSQFIDTTRPRRSSSIVNLFAPGSQSIWPSQTNRTRPNKLTRRARPRGSSLSSTTRPDSTMRAMSDDLSRPAKRRDVSDPNSYQRSIYTSSSCTTTDTRDVYSPSAHKGSSQQLSLRSSTNSPLPTIDTLDRASTPIERSVRDSLHSKSTRTSAAHSEVLSTIGSGSESKSLSDYDSEIQSDILNDPTPARTARISTGKRGPPIDTIFDDSPPPPIFSSGRSTRLRDFLSDGQPFSSEMNSSYRHSTIEEEGSVLSTPVRSVRDHSVTSTPSLRPRIQTILASSPPVAHISSRDTEEDWDFPDVESPNFTLDLQARPDSNSNPRSPGVFPTLQLGRHLTHTMSNQSTPNRGGLAIVEKASLFDWSEQQPSPSRGTHSPPRPKTVHGKKDAEIRNGRSAGRRAPSGMHARSHSVPAVPDVEGKRSTAAANKFGTWGVGSKGVTEDWNDDFDFEDVVAGPSIAIHEERRIDSGHEMFVPQNIREQQENVVANISLLREWGLVIEELKDLRIRAAAVGILAGPYATAWEEVDAMIELADQESEEKTLDPRMSPPSSPGFDYGAFEDLPSRQPRRSIGQIESEQNNNEPDLDARFELESSPSHGGRPRKNSEAVARMVIEALQSKRTLSNVPALRRNSANRKVPFDTATLRHIVPYVNGLKWRVKDALRETEGLYSSPHRHSPSDLDNLDDDFSNDSSFQNILSPPGTKQHSTTDRAWHGQTLADSEDDVFASSAGPSLSESFSTLRIPP